MVSLSITPEPRAAAAVAILNVEPGGYIPCTARFTNGVAGSSLSLSYSSEKLLRSYPGALAHTSTSPVFGFITATLPARQSSPSPLSGVLSPYLLAKVDPFGKRLFGGVLE